MTTFLTQGPQPGDGSWLLQHSSQQPTSGSRRGGGRRRARGRKLQKETFLARKDSVVANDVDTLPSQPPAVNDLNLTGTFLRVHEESKQTSYATPAHALQPRALTFPKQQLLLSPPASKSETPAVDAGPSALARTTFITKLPPSPPKEAPAINNNIEYNARSISSNMTTTKAIPPHLRARAAPVLAKTESKPASGESPTGDVRTKLSSLGVSVSAPMLTASAPNHGWRNGITTTSPAKAQSPSSDKPVYRGHGGGGSHARGRGGGRHTTPRQPKARDNGWLRAKDIPKGDPKRWETDWAGEWANNNQGWAGESNNGKNDSIDSACADGGRGGNGNRRPQHDTADQLADWQGKWAPAPCDWDCRPAFRANQNENQIWQWIASTEQCLKSETRQPSLDELSTVEGITYVFGTPNHGLEHDPQDIVYEQMGDIVPLHWIPVLYGREVPQKFWHNIVQSTEPPPEDEGDLDGVSPWWVQLVAGGTFLANYAPPKIDGIDPDESAQEKMKREADMGANQHAENRKRFELAKREDRLAKQKRKDEKSRKVLAVKAANNGESPKQLQRIIPDVKVFLRHAKPEDMHQLRDLYNYYVDFTCAVPETERVSSADLFKRRNDVISRKLPFLVACEPGGVIKGRRRKNVDEDIIIPDKIIGFAFADDHTGPRGNIYRYTVEAEVYVHQDFVMKGVAKCLMDKLMAMLDPEYLERGGYDVRDDDLETGVARPSRVIKTILMNFKHESSKPAKMEWVHQWLKNFMGFESVGYLESIGTKLGLEVNQAILQRQTGVTIDLANPPDVLKAPPQTF